MSLRQNFSSSFSFYYIFIDKLSNSMMMVHYPMYLMIGFVVCSTRMEMKLIQQPIILVDFLLRLQVIYLSVLYLHQVKLIISYGLEKHIYECQVKNTSNPHQTHQTVLKISSIKQEGTLQACSSREKNVTSNL